MCNGVYPLLKSIADLVILIDIILFDDDNIKVMADTVPDLPAIYLPPTPKSGKNLPEYHQRVTEWTRQCEQSVRTLEKHIRLLITKVNAP
jgi:hypothetical protein